MIGFTSVTKRIRAINAVRHGEDHVTCQAARWSPAVSSCCRARLVAGDAVEDAVVAVAPFSIGVVGVGRFGECREYVGDGDVAIMGGATTINQYLAAGLIDELRLHIVPLTLGAGTRLFEGVPPLKLEQVKSRPASLVTHVTYRVLP
ncbi:dihydrofolate reductase family protein [Phytohabitans kaempferiae]|uniref:Dihydrofolate reductase family protein n=1 Tax=Phytohabitans kaempferiae TaxID=1620943 RepID=A0ABV6MFI1_9ACTN